MCLQNEKTVRILTTVNCEPLIFIVFEQAIEC